MLLAVDIGNTNIHMGIWDGERWGASWRAQTLADKMPDEYGVLLGSFLANSGLKRCRSSIVGSGHLVSGAEIVYAP